jgi:phenylalanyl-tRNA synthetase beta chain
MGGQDTEVRAETTNILLEAANFEPVGILRSSERHAVRTEGSNRWEKGVDPHLADEAAVFATELIVQLSGGRWVGHVDVRGELPHPPVVPFRTERANELIGLEIPADDQLETLRRLGIEGGDDGPMTVPTWRARDLTREADLVEEVARFHLSEVPFTISRGEGGLLTREQRLRRRVEDVLAACGCAEAYTSSLVADDPAPDAIRLPMPLSADQAVLRTTLLNGLVDSARRNVDAGNEGIALFELARVYLPSGEARPQEHWHAGCIVEGGFFRAKGILEAVFDALHVELHVERGEWTFLHPGKAARVTCGWLGELHPSLLEGEWGIFELDLRSLFEHVPERLVYEDVITYPALRQDLAFVVAEDVAAGDVIAAAREAAGPELLDMRVFDVYRGGQIPDGKKSIAFRVAFQSPERTLSDDDARVLRDKIVSALAERFDAELRA